MSNRWPAGIIRKTPVTPAGPFQNGAASGVWSLADAAYWTKQGLWPIAGNEQLVVEDVFSTYLYTGTGSAQTITNGIDLAGNGGLVWAKARSAAQGHILADTVRGLPSYLQSNSNSAAATWAQVLTSFNSNGFSLGTDNTINGSGNTVASWTFRKAPNFFDVVTWTGNGATLQTINHNLGSAPGMLVIKRTDAAEDWFVYHRSTGQDSWLSLNKTNAVTTNASGNWNVTSTTFDARNWYNANVIGATYVAYLYAHDATSDGIIQCGSFTADASGNATVDLGWEPQWLLYKHSSTTGNWLMKDDMRGYNLTQKVDLFANLSNAESSSTTTNVQSPTATGFTFTTALTPNATYIYMAIRRGPMRTPTLGTSVFGLDTGGSTSPTPPWFHTSFPVDLGIWKNKISGTSNWNWTDRLRGSPKLSSDLTDAEGASSGEFDFQNGFYNLTIVNTIYQGFAFKRAPGFFDTVCYTGTGNPLTLNHNLGVAPELILYKSRSNAEYWFAQSSALSSVTDGYLLPNYDSAAGSISGLWRTPSATTFGIALSGNLTGANTAGVTYVSYLFASCPGVSKVGAYTGTGALQTINCAFTTGARFVLIKRTDSTGDWYVWDSARGISSGNDPYLLLNAISAEVTGTNYVDTDTTGFKVTAAAPAGINASGGTYIFLAIA